MVSSLYAGEAPRGFDVRGVKRLSGSSGLRGGGGSLLGAVVVLALGGVGLLVSLVRAVDGNLDSDLATLNLLPVHLRDSLLLLLLVGKSNEAEATTLAGLSASLELLDHEARDRAESNLGRRWLVGSEELLKL